MRLWPFGRKATEAPPTLTPSSSTPPDPYEEELRLVDAWLAARVGQTHERYIEVYRAVEASAPEGEAGPTLYEKAWRADAARQWKLPEARAFLDLGGTARGRVATACLRRTAALRWPSDGSETYDHDRFGALGEAANRLLRPAGAIDRATYPDLVRAWIAGRYDYGFGPAGLVALLEEFVAEDGLTPELRAIGMEMNVELGGRIERWSLADYRRAQIRLVAMLEPQRFAIEGRPEPWQRAFDAPEFTPLIAHAQRAKGAKMTASWRREARPLLANAPDFLGAFEASVVALGGMSVTVDAIHSDEHRGFAWLAGLSEEARAATLLGRMVRASAHKIPNFGARAQKGFGAAVAALETMDGFPALAALSQAAHAVAQPNLAEIIREALTRSVERQGVPIEEIEELVVPTFGLEAGRRVETFDDVTAEIEIVGTTDVEVRWSRGGKPLKSAPASVKENHAEGLKELKRLTKEIGESLSAQRSRIEGLLLSERRLPYAQWRERYLDHPLLGSMSRRLIWRFETPENVRTGIAPDGVILDAGERPLEGLDEATVSLWHPLGAGMATIETWRGSLADRGISQPFKQAYREIYLLTDAERVTGTYSNRFAAHILKQHQMAALARTRGWRYALMGYFDCDDRPTKRYERWELNAEFTVEVPGWDANDRDALQSEAGIALYLVTDAVRFLDAQERPVALAEVPPLLLSEAMRDVDLFVGVASVGNDPTWTDQAQRFGQMAEWRSLAFGALGTSAETRRDALERLLPRLAIAPVARLEGRFLVVRGRLRTYRIHLGSSNILMAPDDQYLCIVPTPSRGDGRMESRALALPFEGDGTLAAILSKAFLLARDNEIRDETILRQIRGHVPLMTFGDADLTE